MDTRPEYALLMSAVAVWCASTFPHRAAAQNFTRLPPTYTLAQREQLLKPENRPAVNGPELETRGLVQFAGGSIELQVPQGWWAEEVPFGRELRLVIAPQRPANVRRMPIDGMWMVYHADLRSESHGDEALSRELSERIRSAGDSNGRYSTPTPFQFGKWPAVVTEFTASDASSANTSITGRHVLVRTEWGVLEFHASAPDAIVKSRSNIWSETWDSLRLNPPPATGGSIPDGSSESNSIIGDWKAFRSRMRFTDDGRIVIIPDALDGNRTSRPLTGTFEARDDLVFVLWDDGSRLNFRWRLQGNDLFLTDHEGQISRLKRVFN